MAEVMVEMGLWKGIPNDLVSYTDQRFIIKATGNRQP